MKVDRRCCALKEIRSGYKGLLIPVLILTQGLLLVSCLFSSDYFRVTSTRYSASEDFSYSVDVADRSRFRLSGINGSVEITGVPGISTVDIWGERKVESESVSDAETHLPLLNVQIREASNEVYVKTEQPRETHGRNYLVYYHCHVPEDWEVITSNVNGGITLASITGDVEIVSTNGEVSVDSTSGDVDVILTNGNLLLWEILGNIEAVMTNGNMTGRIELPESGRCEIGVTNGLIDLSIPVLTSAEFDATVVNGSISMSNLTLENISSTPTSLSGRLGSGNGIIVLSTVNGVIYVRGY